MRKVFFFCLAVALLAAVSAMAQNKVVVVPLSSSKISKEQTLTYGIYSLQIPTLGTVHGCSSNSSGSSLGHVPLTLPIGAEIVSAKALIYDSASAEGYTLRLVREASQATGLSTYTISNSVTGGSNTEIVVEENLTPTSTQIVEEGESFHISFHTGGVFANGFCGAQVTIKLP